MNVSGFTGTPVKEGWEASGEGRGGRLGRVGVGEGLGGGTRGGGVGVGIEEGGVGGWVGGGGVRGWVGGGGVGGGEVSEGPEDRVPYWKIISKQDEFLLLDHLPKSDNSCCSSIATTQFHMLKIVY